MPSKKELFSRPTRAQATAAAIVTSVGEEEVAKQIALEKIYPDPENRSLTKLDRRDPTNIDPADPYRAAKQQFLEGLKELAETIREQGVIQPIQIYERGGKYYIVHGERRYLASVLAGRKTIPAFIVRKPERLRTIQAIENLSRDDVLPWERIKSVMDVLEEHRRLGEDVGSIRKLARVLGKSPTQAQAYLTIIRGPEDVREALRQCRIGSIKQAAEIAAIESKKRREQAIADPSTLQPGGVGEGRTRTATPSPPEKKPKRAGRRRQQVNLGRTGDLAKVRRIILALTDDPDRFDGLDWEDPEDVQAAWDAFFGEEL